MHAPSESPAATPDGRPEAAEEGNRLRDELLQTLAHDLRNPLSAMLGWIDVLNRVGGPQIQGPVEAMRRSVELQDQTLANALDLSRLLQGTLTLELRELPPERAAQAAVEAVRAAAGRKRVTVDFALQGPLPSVTADAVRLQQMFQSLGLHALRSTPDGGRLQVALEARDGGVRLQICDGGRGLGDEELARLSAALRDPAAGSRVLGSALLLARGLARLHGAELGVDRAGSGQGVCFTVSLPTAGDASRPRNPGPSLAGLQVLLVTRAADPRPALAAVLGEAQARVRTAQTADEALARFESDPPDLVIVDTVGAGNEARTLMRTLRSRAGAHRPLRALALVPAEPGTDPAAFSAGFDGCLSEPVETQKLLTVVAAHAASLRSRGAAS